MKVFPLFMRYFGFGLVATLFQTVAFAGSPQAVCESAQAPLAPVVHVLSCADLVRSDRAELEKLTEKLSSRAEKLAGLLAGGNSNTQGRKISKRHEKIEALATEWTWAADDLKTSLHDCVRARGLTDEEATVIQQELDAWTTKYAQLESFTKETKKLLSR